MSEWIYRASKKTESVEDTLNRIFAHQFLCRTAFNAKGALIPNVKNVRAGDTLHLIFNAGGGKYDFVGSFEISKEAHTAHDSWVFNPSDGTALSLFRVKDPSALSQNLTVARSRHDPRLGCFTGWHLTEVDTGAIETDSLAIGGMSSLHRYTSVPKNFEARSALRTTVNKNMHSQSTLHMIGGSPHDGEWLLRIVSRGSDITRFTS